MGDSTSVNFIFSEIALKYRRGVSCEKRKDGGTMNLKQIETFVWVAALGSFRKAAEKLNSSQPAVSSRINALEELLNVKLFDRGATTSKLTTKGIELLPHAQKLLLMGERFKEIACESTALNGVLRLGVSETIVHTWLSDFLKSAHLSIPGVDIEVTVDVTSNMRNDLVSRTLDLAFLMGPISEYRIENIELCSYSLVWTCSPSLELPQGLVNIETLLQKPILTYARNTRPFAELSTLSRLEGVDILRLFPSTSLSACRRMTIDGLGIGMLPIEMIYDDVAKGDLRMVESTWYPSGLDFTASFPRDPFNPIAEKMAMLAVEVVQSRTRK